jgi:hypothetical protein
MQSESLYEELKPAMQEVANALFAMSEMLLRKHGNFMPNGVTLTQEGTVKHVAAGPDTEFSNSTIVLPLLHESLRHEARASHICATGVAENVTIKVEGQEPTEALKVLFEHRKGLTVALYLPYKKTLFRGYVLGEVFSRSAAPEVNAFGASNANFTHT